MPSVTLKTDKYLAELVQLGAVPGISIYLGDADGEIYSSCCGWRSLIPNKQKLSLDTIYDLASLTKPLLTSMLFALMLERKILQLNDRVKKHLPGFSHEITLKDLLLHVSGLPAWYPFYLYRADLVDQISGLRLQNAPGKKIVYSCVGYMLLARILEKATGQDLETLGREMIFSPLGLRDTFITVPEKVIDQVAPTEKGNAYEKELCLKAHGPAAKKFAWRETLIQGRVHDVNSFHLEGRSGNAGLFSSLRDVARLCLEFHPQTASLLKSATLDLFWKAGAAGPGGRRSMGFRLNSVLSSAGRVLDRQAIGHNGFTGTSLWIEPRGARTWLIFSNRVHPRVPETNFNKIRRRIHRLLAADLGFS